MNEHDNLDDKAVEIATEHLLKGRPLREMARDYASSASTLHRRLTAWREQGRFQIVDQRAMAARVVRRDERLEEELARRTLLWRARVVEVEGVSLSSSNDHLLEPGSAAAISAFRASDELHRVLGIAAAEVFLGSLKRHGTVGVASGRGVGFTISGLEELARRQPSWLRGYETIHLQSLCGGGHVGTWATPVARDLDADQNVFALASVLGVSKTSLGFMGGWIAARESLPAKRSRGALDLALVGLGQLNSHHHFFHHYQDVQLGEMAAPLARIRALQAKDPGLISSVAEMAHRLFVVGEGTFPPELQAAMSEINRATLAVSPQRLKAAGEVVLVAGGAQKVPVLRELLMGRCPDAALDLSRLTLVTDATTARAILQA